MFKRPEEIIVLVLAVLWVVLTYFLAAYCGADAYTVILITGLTLVWAAVCFRFWQKGWERNIWPVFGMPCRLLVADVGLARRQRYCCAEF